jgi:hypothetical protein
LEKESGQWLFEEAKDVAKTITLPSVRCVLSVGDTYDGVDLQRDPTSMPRDIPPENS